MELVVNKDHFQKKEEQDIFISTMIETNGPVCRFDEIWSGDMIWILEEKILDFLLIRVTLESFDW